MLSLYYGIKVFRAYVEMIIQVLCIPDDLMMQQMIFRTQQHLNSYARQGLRVLVMAKRTLSDMEYNDWLRKHEEATLVLENRERRIRDSYSRLETNLTLLGKCMENFVFIFFISLCDAVYISVENIFFLYQLPIYQ